MTPTVYAVVKATIEVSLPPLGSGGTLEDLYGWAQREGEVTLRAIQDRIHDRTNARIKVIGPVEFSHARIAV